MIISLIVKLKRVLERAQFLAIDPFLFGFIIFHLDLFFFCSVSHIVIFLRFFSLVHQL